ncbi:MAG: aminodeoxychorismate lyase [Gammaproteobacteria bacterium HGW-Gammaproteobacteria-3]|nr:MAG: aminodeoxychorismate lyase [Gammaproteobacteria bacterium HGW-Gammaproteobacteria-3]
MVLVNGEPRQFVSIFDRGFQYGDGLFETIEISGGHPVYLDRHLKRLKLGCERLKIPCPDRHLLVHEAQSLAENQAQAVLKVIITRGLGGRGYRQPDVLQPTRVISLHPFPEYPEVFKRQGIRARFCSTRLGLNPALAGIKHLNRLEQVLARAEWSEAAIQEGLMLDSNDHVIEGTMTNLFYIADGQLHTAPLTQTGVAGIMREIIIELAKLNRLEVAVHFFKTPDLLAAEEIFVCNSIIGLWPVTELETRIFVKGTVTRRIMSWLACYKQQWLGQ